MSWAKSFHRLIVSLWTAPSWEMMRGTITAIATFVSLVSLVVHSRYLSSFSLKALFILSVDVTFTSTTTFFELSPESLLGHTRSGFSLAPLTRPFSFHSSDLKCSVPMVISSCAFFSDFRSSQSRSWVAYPLYVKMLFRMMFTTMSWRALFSHDTFLQQMTICLAFSGYPVMLNQHLVSVFFF